MIRLLAVDIDGTLLDGRGRLPDAHRDALVEASARGIEIALATGRSFHFTDAVVDRLPIPLTLIVNNGAVVKRKTGETEWRHVLDRVGEHGGQPPKEVAPRRSRRGGVDQDKPGEVGRVPSVSSLSHFTTPAPHGWHRLTMPHCAFGTASLGPMSAFHAGR